MRLAEASVRRPVFAVMLIGAVATLGLVSAPRLAADLFPNVELPLVTVSTVLPGASPDTVAREVTEILEEAINNIEGVKAIRSSSTDSLSQIVVEFGLAYDVLEKMQEVRGKVAASRGQLPTDVEPPIIDRLDPDSTPVLALLVSGPGSVRQLTEFADKTIRRKLERVPGVGSVRLVGGRAREIRIWLDPVRLAGYGLAVNDVISAVRREHLELPAGRIESGRSEIVIKTQGKMFSAAQFRDLVLSQRGGGRIHLGDVAEVEDGRAAERTVSRLNGHRGVALAIRRQSGENTIDVVDRVRASLVELRASLPPGVEIVEAQDLSRFIRSSIRDVTVDLAWGSLLTAIVVLVFLRNARTTLITALAIPASLTASLSFFYFFDFTFNLMTLMALSLSIGILIDDAIVVGENVHRHVESGSSPRRAAVEGTREVGLAVVATTLALCAVFVPIAFMEGMVGRFFHEFGLVVACAVATSTLVALSLTPMLCSRYMRAEDDHGPLWLALEGSYRAIEHRYRLLLERALAHRKAVMGVAAVAALGGIAVALIIPIDFIISTDRSEFNVRLKMPVESRLGVTEEAVASVEAALMEHPEVEAVFSIIAGGAEQRSDEAILYVKLTPKQTRSDGMKAVMSDARARIRALNLPLREFSVEEIVWVSLPGVRDYQFAAVIKGSDPDRLHEIAAATLARMNETSGFIDGTSSHEPGKRQLDLVVDRDRAAEAGVSAATVGLTVNALFSDYRVASFEENGERYDIRTRVLPEFRDDPAQIGLVFVRSPSGSLVNVADLVETHLREGPVSIERNDRARAVTLYANLDGKALWRAFGEVKDFARDAGMGKEEEIVAAGFVERMLESVSSVIFALGLALVAIYIILAAQFNSFVHPLTIMLSAPLAFIGACAALRLFGLHLDMMGQIGFLMLMGLVMKNGILLVDYTNTLREQGLATRDAVLAAAPTRFRPVLMTTLSTVFGMLPVALGRGDGAELRVPMAVIAIGGMLSSTALTLIVVPVAYTLLADAEQRLRQVLSGRFASVLPESRPVALPTVDLIPSDPSDLAWDEDKEKEEG